MAYRLFIKFLLLIQNQFDFLAIYRKAVSQLEKCPRYELNNPGTKKYILLKEVLKR